MERFSRRFGHTNPAAEITVRNDAPPNLRAAVLAIAGEEMSPGFLRRIVCNVLRCLPDPNNWSEYPNIANEVQELVLGCKWPKVYDIIEAIYAALKTHFLDGGQEFRNEINLYFVEEGIGWQLTEDGKIEVRGSDAFEVTVAEAERQLNSSGQATAASEIREAIRDLSCRPEPDRTGAVQHAMAALECVARTATGEKVTLGEILKRYPSLVPPPLGQALEKLWGYASEMARHVREGAVPGFEEVELVVSQAAAASTYLSKKYAA